MPKGSYFILFYGAEKEEQGSILSNVPPNEVAELMKRFVRVGAHER